MTTISSQGSARSVRVARSRAVNSSIGYWQRRSSRVVVPVAGQYYYALHPGQTAFTVSHGRLLKNEDFKGYVERAALSGKVTVRTERLDDTIIVFLDNGTANPVKGRVQFELKNLLSSNGNPVTLTVPAQTEVFVALLNPVDILDSYSVNATVSANWAK